MSPALRIYILSLSEEQLEMTGAMVVGRMFECQRFMLWLERMQRDS